MTQVAIIAEFTIKPEHVAAFTDRMRDHASASRQEPGCLRFDMVIPRKGENRMMLYELYQDQAALDFHAGTDRMKAHREATGDMLEDRKLHICDMADGT